MRSTKTMLGAAVLCAAIPLTVLRAQLPGGATDKRATTGSTSLQSAAANTTAMLPDFYPLPGGGTTTFEQWTPDHPCTPHSHTYVKFMQAGRRNGVFPSPTVALYRNGQKIDEWTVNVPAGPTPVNVLKFTWTVDHPCPDGNATVTQYQPNYRLVIDPGNRVNEHSETNNALDFYVNPIATYVKLP